MPRKIGVNYLGKGRCDFVLWAPLQERVSLYLPFYNKVVPLTPEPQGYFRLEVSDIEPNTPYFYRLKENIDRPDPISYYQPDDVFGASFVVDHAAFRWSDDNWKSIPLDKMIIYEMHIGAFTPEGTFQSAIERLDYLKDLGITALEIMPIAQFPGGRNWGYDGVYPFAVQNSYGGPEGFKSFVDACHQKGMAVILDVVYNHLGPEGNFVSEYMPLFTGKYHTPWGEAINFDDSYSFGVRNYFIQNALYWFENYHVDALRLDAVHTIYDMGAKHFLKELAEAVDDFSIKKGREFYLIAESDLNDTKIILSASKGGYGIDAQWSDDFHHALHTLLTQEKLGYYEDFGQLPQLAKAIKEGFVYAWDYSIYRKRYYGSSSKEIPAEKFIVCAQNHDQIGNRHDGARLSALVSFEALKLAAATVLLSPYIPLIFMGEEYGEESPFLYFMSFHDEHLIKAVREGRKKECALSDSQKDPADPYIEETFLSTKLNWQKCAEGRHKALLAFYKKLITLRKTLPSLGILHKERTDVVLKEAEKVMIVTRSSPHSTIVTISNFNTEKTRVSFDHRGLSWSKIFDSSDRQWEGPGTLSGDLVHDGEMIPANPLSVVLYELRL